MILHMLTPLPGFTPNFLGATSSSQLVWKYHFLEAFWCSPPGQVTVGGAVLIHSSTCITLTTPCHCLWFVYLFHQIMSSRKTQLLFITVPPALSTGPDTKEAPAKGACNTRNTKRHTKFKCKNRDLCPSSHKACLKAETIF